MPKLEVRAVRFGFRPELWWDDDYDYETRYGVYPTTADRENPDDYIALFFNTNQAHEYVDWRNSKEE